MPIRTVQRAAATWLPRSCLAVLWLARRPQRPARGGWLMLDHATLRTHDLEGTRHSWRQCWTEAGLSSSLPFPVIGSTPPITHRASSIPGQGGSVDRSGETIDHVGFASRHDGMRERLEALAVPIPDGAARARRARLFVRTPTGILLELVFREAGAAATRLPGRHRVMLAVVPVVIAKPQ